MAESTLLQIGLPDLPDETIDPKLYDDFVQLHRAIKSLAQLVSKYCGIDAQTPDVWSSLVYADTLLSANLVRLYPIADVPITAGQMVNLYNNAGNLRARLANAGAAATMAHGVCNSSVLAGNQFEMYWLRGLVNTIGGMVPGTLYYISTTGGAIQNVAPAVAGQIQQPAGIALTSSQLLMDIPLRYIQL